MDSSAIPLTIITWLWHQDNYHTEFTADHVRMLRNAVEDNYPYPHNFICVTNDEIDDVHTIPLSRQWADIPNPSRPERGPSCYRRLQMFKMPGHIVSLDLDTVIAGRLAPLWHRPEDIVLWSDPIFEGRYNGSMILYRGGTHPELYDDFDPVQSPIDTKDARLFGSDQAWISYKLGWGMPVWTRDDGVYSFRLLDPPPKAGRAHRDKPKTRELPDNARIVFFHGRSNPWDDDVLDEYPWVRDYYDRYYPNQPARRYVS